MPAEGRREERAARAGSLFYLVCVDRRHARQAADPPSWRSLGRLDRGQAAVQQMRSDAQGRVPERNAQPGILRGRDAGMEREAAVGNETAGLFSMPRWGTCAEPPKTRFRTRSAGITDTAPS